MTNNQKIKRFREIYSDFLVAFEKIKAKVAERSTAKLKAQEKAEIDELLSKINKDY